MALSDAIWAWTGRLHELPLIKLAQYLHRFLTQNGIAPETATAAITADYTRKTVRREKLDFT